MSERYVIKDRWIFDTKLNKNIHSIDCYEEKSVLDIMNSQDQRISELEEQLKNSIRPKFKIGDKVYAIIDTWAYTDVFQAEIRDTHLLYEVWDGEDTTKQHSTRIFATKEEAKAKLEELQGE